MMLKPFAKFSITIPSKTCLVIVTFARKCHGSAVGVKNLIEREKPSFYTVNRVKSRDYEMAVDIIKRYFLSEHVLVQARKMDLSNDRALDQYLINLLEQGNSTFGIADDGTVAGLCVSYASSPLDPKALQNYASYRQDRNTKDFLCFTAKLQETPNLWDIYKQPKVFEIKMVTVLPEYRRHGLATMLTKQSKEQAHDHGFKVIRMDCINPFNYKIAERCAFQCIAKFPLHVVRGTKAPYITQRSEHNRCVRVYVSLLAHGLERDREQKRRSRDERESLLE